MRLPDTSLPPSKISLDVVDDLLFVSEALNAAIAENKISAQLHRATPGWIPYIANFDEASRVVIVRAELTDHVPTVLKVRALSRIDSWPIVLADRPSESHVRRLYEAGAGAVLTSTHSFDQLLQAIRAADSGQRTTTSADEHTPVERRLSDRELQVAALFTSDTAPSTRLIAELLGLPHASVRTHLQRARAALQSVTETSTRESLAEALVSDGWIDAAPR